MASDFPELTFNDLEDFDADRLNAAMRVLDTRLRAQEALRASYEDAVDILNRYGLVRLNDAIQPVYDRLKTIGNIGVIFTTLTDTPNRIGVGQKTFVIPADRRLTFAPAAYLQILSTGDAGKSIYGATQSYNDSTGELKVLVDTVRGIDEGVITSWRISPAGTPVVFNNANDLGVYTQAQADAKIAQAITNLKGGAPDDLATLGAINAALLALTDGAVNIRNFAQASTAINNRLQVDAAQGLNDTARRIALTNLGVSDFIRSLLVASDGTAARGILGIGNVDLSGYATKGDVNGKVSKSGDSITGDLNLTGRIVVGVGQPASYIEMRDTDEGTRYIHNNSGLIGFLGSGGDWVFRVGDGGAIWTKQFGDLNSRIEQRAADFANDRLNQAQAYARDRKNESVLTIRYVYAGDLGNDWNIQSGFQSPYGGWATMVDRATGFGNASDQLVQSFRWRYLQMYIPASGGWVGSYAAS